MSGNQGQPSMRFFNTEGPVDPARHYCLPPLERRDLAEVLGLIELLVRAVRRLLKAFRRARRGSRCPQFR